MFSLFACFALLARPEAPLYIKVLAVFPLSIYIGFVEALVIGLTADEKWDAAYNPFSSRRSSSG